MKTTLELAKDLLQKKSITPKDEGCQTLIAQRLKALGFTVHHLRFGEVDNLWATRGTDNPLFVFAGHTDVVPIAHPDQWNTDPFTPTIKDGSLYARGASDMKGALAAMLIATEQFIADNPHHKGTMGFLLTSDEEGPAINGTAKVVEYLKDNGIKIDYCVIGEPTSKERLGDTLKIGRRGSMTGHLTVQGKSGHVAYPHLATNPIHSILKTLHQFTEHTFDTGNEYFPSTSFQITHVESGVHNTTNVIPEHFHCQMNFRFSPESSAASLQQQIQGALKAAQVNYSLAWTIHGEPFMTPKGELVNACMKAINAQTGSLPALCTSGGTSDGRFIAPMGTQVVELGVLNKTIHQANEYVQVEDLETLMRIYKAILRNILG